MASDKSKKSNTKDSSIAISNIKTAVNDVIIVEEVYSYKYPHRLKDGTIKNYTHNYTHVPKKPKKTAYENWLNQEIDRISSNFIHIQKLNNLMNKILHHKAYNERNMKKQLNKVRARGNLSKKTEDLVKLVYKKSDSIANSIEKEILLLLAFMNEKDEEEKVLTKELKKLDKGGFDNK